MFKKYFEVYKMFMQTSITEALSFRFNFSLQNIMNLCFMLSFFGTTSFIFNHIEHIGVWNQIEFFFFLSFVFAVDQTHYTFFSYNFWRLSDDIRLGSLDFHLLKPISSLFLLFMKNIASAGFITSTTCYGLIIYFGIQLGIPWLSWVLIPICLVLSVALLVSIEILISMLNFITIESMGVNQLRLQIQHLIRWPDFIYKNPFRLSLLPFLAISSFPVRFLLDNQAWAFLLAITVAFLLMASLVLWLWPKALKTYQSPSS